MIPFNLMPFLLQSINAPVGVRLVLNVFFLFFFYLLAHNVLTHTDAARWGGATLWGGCFDKGFRSLPKDLKQKATNQ